MITHGSRAYCSILEILESSKSTYTCYAMFLGVGVRRSNLAQVRSKDLSCPRFRQIWSWSTAVCAPKLVARNEEYDDRFETSA